MAEETKTAKEYSTEEYTTYTVKIKVISQKGYCGWHHKVGDEWTYAYDPGNPAYRGICPAAYYAMFKNIWMFWFGGAAAWPTPDPDTCKVACPDAENPVAFSITRLRDEAKRVKYT